MSAQANVLKHPDPKIMAILRPIISDRSGDPHCKSQYIPQQEITALTSLSKFDYLDIFEMGMAFESEYIAQTGKQFRIEEKDFDILATIDHVGEFCYALHCCIEGKPIPHKPSNMQKIKAKFVQMNANIKNFLSEQFAKTRAI